ncbi:GntR family transcriptional regulator [Paenibacillus sp. GCM10027626]|uniref:GntR family transcriptional regulator n=1 Tax=Paenibacillus sp. GCM10027626 TaxID=3273411 RepID=UPI00363ED3EC
MNGERTPLYTQIYSFLRDQMESGKWQEGFKLPSENQLCRKFDVSRITVRGAMTQLVEEGFIYRIQGRGSFVAGKDKTKEPVRYAPRSAQLQQAESSLPLIAVIVPRLSGLLITGIISGLNEGLAFSSYRILLLLSDGVLEKEDEMLREALALGAQGIVVYPTEGRVYNETMLRLSLDRFPIVVIDRYLSGVPTNCVCSDHYSGAYEATEHLLQLGHRNIAFVTTPFGDTTSSIEERLGGYRQAMNDYSVVIERSFIQVLSADEELRAFLDQHREMTALFAINEQLGLRLIKAADDTERVVPDDLSVVFFDDYAHSEFARIPPTCVTQDGEQIGRDTAALLLELLEQPEHERERKLIRVPTRLKIRQSTKARQQPI